MTNLLSWLTSPFTSTRSANGDNVDDNTDHWRLSLDDAVREASSLLAFASRSGISLEPNQMKPILDMSRVLEKGDDIIAIDTDNEQDFWRAYSEVVAKIHPVTSDSIQATLENGLHSQNNLWRNRTIAQKTVFRYGVYSLVVLVAIIYFQSYMQMGTSVRNHLQISFESQKKAIDDLFLVKITEEDNRLKKSGQEGQQNFVKALYDKYKVELQIAKLRASQDELFSWGKVGDKVLNRLGMESDGQYNYDTPINWGNWLSKVTVEPTTTTSPAPSNTETKSPSNTAINPATNQDTQAAIKRDDAMVVDELKIVVIPTYLALNESEQILRMISEFILPLLYGLLGACAYILRDLRSSISSVTFSKSSMINYNLRLLMGPLVGIAVGLFFGTPAVNFISGGDELKNTATSVTTSITSVGTVGFAFLAGYSVEVLFSALETLVNAFGSKGQSNSQDIK